MGPHQYPPRWFPGRAFVSRTGRREKPAGPTQTGAERALHDHLAGLGHDLRSPLASMLMISESLREQTYGPLNEQQHAMLAHLEGCGRQLLEYLNNLVDLAKVEAGRMELAPATVSVREVCDASIHLAQETLRENKLQVELEIQPSGLTVHADAQRLKQMLVTMLGLAIHATPAGEHIGLDVQLMAGNSQVRFLLQCAGPVRAEGPAGLELAVVRRLTEQQHGMFSMECEPDKGSRFEIRLPAGSS